MMIDVKTHKLIYSTGFKVAKIHYFEVKKSFQKNGLGREIVKDLLLELKALGIEKGSATPNKVKVGVLTKEKLEEIAKVKQPDLNANTLEAAINIVAGSARSMGVTLEKL